MHDVNDRPYKVRNTIVCFLYAQPFFPVMEIMRAECVCTPCSPPTCCVSACACGRSALTVEMLSAQLLPLLSRRHMLMERES